MRFAVISFVTLIATNVSIAQSPAPLRLQWKPGQVTTYAVRQTTTVDEILLAEGTNKPQVGRYETKMNLTYQWAVSGIDPAGVATIEKTVTAFKSESTRTGPGKDGKPDTTTDTLDSTIAADREKMPFLNKVAVVAQVDGRGNVIDAKSEFGETALARFKTELPFRLTLTDKPLTPGQTWDRSFAITLDPKLGGTGEQVPAVQKCTFKGMSGTFAVVGVATTLPKPPQGGELRPLIPMLWEGDVFFDTTNGRYHACKLVALKELTNHEGDGTKFSYRSEYVESVQEKK